MTDEKGNKIEWKSSDMGANKPQNVRPLSIFPSKEEKNLLQEFVPLVEQEVNEIRHEGVSVKLSDRIDKKACCDSALLSMIDGKMVTSLLQLGGAYCTMCTVNLVDAHKVEVIEHGFNINRSIQSITDLALTLMDPETGEIPTKSGDYNVRQGIMDKPITETDVTNIIPVCHT